MLRNSTKKFKEKYEGNAMDQYRSFGVMPYLSEEIGFGREKVNSRVRTQVGEKVIRTHKIQQSMQNKTMSIKTKFRQPLQINGKNELQSTKMTHRRQLTSPVSKKQTDEESIASISSIKWRNLDNMSTMERDPKEFIDQLSKNSVFYCCQCYQYVFEIEKKRHFPDCKDRLDLSARQDEDQRKMCWNLLDRIIQLSKYTNTKTWEIQQLNNQMKTLQFSKIFSVNYPPNPSFFTLSQILQAFVYTYQQLLKGSILPKSTIFSCF